ncbi:MAG: cold-shock protein [Sedimenticolaceae bacterium]|jgi:CspA family cold shock protein
MITGKVKFFDMTKGFGFIAPNDGSKDVFVHISALQRSGIDKLVDNQVVNFEITEERGKQAATNLSLA